MHATYWKDDDLLEVRFSDKPIAREVSESWYVHKSETLVPTFIRALAKTGAKTMGLNVLSV